MTGGTNGADVAELRARVRAIEEDITRMRDDARERERTASGRLWAVLLTLGTVAVSTAAAAVARIWDKN